MEEKIVNKVEASGLVTLNLEDYYEKGERVTFDIKDNLYEGLLLREKDFRQFVKEKDWSVYAGKHVGIICSADAIVPVWAYMLIVSKVAPYAATVIYGNLDALEAYLFQKALSKMPLDLFKGAKVVIKGCGDLAIPAFAYAELTRVLLPVVQSIMYGEPCSTVPIFKNKQ